MKAIAGRGAGQLAHRHMQVAIQPFLQRRAALELTAKATASICQAAPAPCTNACHGATCTLSSSETPACPRRRPCRLPVRRVRRWKRSRDTKLSVGKKTWRMRSPGPQSCWAKGRSTDVHCASRRLRSRGGTAASNRLHARSGGRRMAPRRNQRRRQRQRCRRGIAGDGIHAAASSCSRDGRGGLPIHCAVSVRQHTQLRRCSCLCPASARPKATVAQQPGTTRYFRPSRFPRFRSHRSPAHRPACRIGAGYGLDTQGEASCVVMRMRADGSASWIG